VAFKGECRGTLGTSLSPQALGDTAQGVFRLRADCWCPR
jgi:hypothetical protein